MVVHAIAATVVKQGRDGPDGYIRGGYCWWRGGMERWCSERWLFEVVGGEQTVIGTTMWRRDLHPALY